MEKVTFNYVPKMLKN